MQVDSASGDEAGGVRPDTEEAPASSRPEAGEDAAAVVEAAPADTAAGGAVGVAHNDDDAICATLFNGLVFFLGCVLLSFSASRPRSALQLDMSPAMGVPVTIYSQLSKSESSNTCLQSGGPQGAAAAGDPVIRRRGGVGRRRLPGRRSR